MSGTQLTREQVARIELGKTEIKPRLAMVMVAVFLGTAALPPCLQIAMDLAKQRTAPPAPSVEGTRTPATFLNARSLLPGPAQWRRVRTLADLAALVPSARMLRQFEDHLNDTSLSTRTLAPWVGWAIKGILHGGDEQAYFGRDGWLFYRPSVDSVTGPGFLTAKWQNERLRTADKSASLPQPDPLKALIQFHRQLTARGIALVVVPTPGKETLQPEKLTSRFKGRAAVLQNPSFDPFKSVLAKEGINVFDPSTILAEMKKRSGDDVYLQSDTHWSAPAMENVAAQLATWLRERDLAPTPGSVDWLARKRAVSNAGDLEVMLNLPKSQRFFPSETVQITRVVTPEGRPWEPDAGAPVLLMGDSFCNIYSLADMGWGDSAGFAEHLSVALGQTLDRLVINAGGAYSARQELVREIASGRDRLAGKRVVIYQFAARELASGDWKLFDLPETSSPPRETTSLDGELVVQGQVAAIARLPQPGSVPYKDCLVAIHLTRVRSSSPGAIKEELLVYTLGMRDNRWLPVSSVTVGTDVRSRLRNWADVEKRYGSYNRAELDDLELLSLPTYWAEEVAR